MTQPPNIWSGGSSGEKLKYLSDEQIEAFFKAVEAAEKPHVRTRDSCMFSLMLAYGLRCAEVPLIKLEHVRLRKDPERSELFVTRVKRKRDKKTGREKPRGGRWYELSDKNRLLLVQWLRARKRFKTAALSNSLFVTAMSGAIGLPTIYGLTVRYGKAAGFKAHPHMFRHTCGIRLAKAGRNAFAIQKRLGHVSVFSTQVYVELAGADRHEEDRRDDAALEGGEDL